METRIVGKMIKAMKLNKEDVVLLNFWGTDKDMSDYEDFKKGFEKEGITAIGNVLTDERFLELMEKNPEGLADNWSEDFKEVTVVVDLMDKAVGVPPVGMTQQMYPLFGKILSQLFQFMSMHEKLIQITMPTEANAQMAGLDFADYEKRMIAALDVDYDKLQKDCEEKVAQLNNPKRVVKTGEGCVLEMDMTGREWNIDAGDGAFPCGEVYIAPVEEKTNGTIYFEKFLLDDEMDYTDVILTIKGGKLVDANYPEIMEFFSSVGEDGADIVAELGIGMNPNVVNDGTDSSLDEDALGTFHIAFGMNNMFGGNNSCRFHMDFVTTGEIE